MHTLIYDNESGSWFVGTWQINREGHDTFVKLFERMKLGIAISTVNMLNGGEPIASQLIERYVYKG